MKTFTATLIFVMMVFIGGRMVGQNLVGNGDFEEYNICPNDQNQIARCTGWQNWCASPDYFDECATIWGVDVPLNWQGYQVAASGQGYAGIATYYSSWYYYPHLPNGRELIAAPLTAPLIIGQKYYAEMKISLSNSSTCSDNGIGIMFTTNSFSQYGTDSFVSPLIKNAAVVYATQIINDTANWVKISGSFIADSSYNYIVIGCLLDDAHIDTFVIIPPICHAYYYIDDVYLSEDTTTGIKEQSNLQVSLSPNPFTTHLQLHYTLTQPGELMVYDALGRKVNSCTLAASQKTFELSVATLPAGVYLVAVESGGRVWGEKVVKGAVR